MSDALRPITSGWNKLFELAWAHKKREYQDSADECTRFLDGPYNNWLFKAWGGGNTGSPFEYGGLEELPAPSTRMTVNKVAELVQLFGPALYHRNPTRKVNPRKVREASLATPQLPPGMAADPLVAAVLQQQQIQQQTEVE